MQRYTLRYRLFTTTFLGISLLVTTAFISACNNNSVVKEGSAPSTVSTTPTGNENSAPVGNAGATPAPAATATPVTLATPMTLSGATTAAETLKNSGVTATGEAPLTGDRHITDFPVELSTAKKSATPEADAFPPRPTPTVEMVNGKIKQQWQAPAEALAMQNPLQRSTENLTKGREWYNQKCADCHGKSGKGNGWMGANLKRDGQPLPPTNLVSQVVQANTDGELFWKITNGRSPMPASRIRFEDEQRWQIVLYLRSLR
jgi:mono/diheme cytochrome c family protein